MAESSSRTTRDGGKAWHLVLNLPKRAPLANGLMIMNLIYRYFFIISIAMLACVQVSGQTEQKAPSREYWPTQAWRTAISEQEGMDSEKLADALDFVRQHEVDIHSL